MNKLGQPRLFLMAVVLWLFFLSTNYLLRRVLLFIGGTIVVVIALDIFMLWAECRFDSLEAIFY